MNLGVIPYPEDQQKGVWLCAWLSGSMDDSSTVPVWMDRWCHAGYFDSTQTIFVSNAEAVYDEPSTMTFDPGVWYRYDHIGGWNE